MRRDSAGHPSNRFRFLNFGKEGVEGWPLGLECFASSRVIPQENKEMEYMLDRSVILRQFGDYLYNLSILTSVL